MAGGRRVAMLADHGSFAVKSSASPAWTRADIAHVEMLFLDCRGTRGVKVVS